MRLVHSLFVAALVIAPTAHAQLNKCIGADGKVSYQSEPCPTTAKAQTVRPPTAPSSYGGTEAGGKGKDGWDPAVLSRMYSGCVAGGMRDGRAGWEKDARANPGLGTFPEAEFRASADSFCRCLTDRVRANLKPEEAESKLPATVVQYTHDAIRGGPCKPTGILGRLLAGG